MLLKETIHKTNTLFHKTLENFKYLFFKGFQKLQKPTSLIPFSCSKGNPQHTHPTEQLYIDVYDSGNVLVPSGISDKIGTIQRRLARPLRKVDRGNVMSYKENIKQEDTNVGKEEQSHARSRQEKNKPAHLRKGDVKNSTTSDGLAQKMKELEMLDRGDDMEQELDIEEAIHYYSRLTSPVYLQIVDIHSEFSVHDPSTKSINSSNT